MKNETRIMRLDMLSVKPYFTLKNLIIFLFLAMFYTVLTKKGDTVAYILSFMAMMYSTYPFMVGEESGIDNLYRIAGINTEEVVRGRYLFAFATALAGSVIGTVFSTMISVITGEGINPQTMAGIALISFIAVTFFVVLQLPFFFRFGYLKAKGIVGISYIIFMMFLMGGAYLIKSNKQLIDLMLQKPLIPIMIFALIYIAACLISYMFSIKNYRMREF